MKELLVPKDQFNFIEDGLFKSIMIITDVIVDKNERVILKEYDSQTIKLTGNSIIRKVKIISYTPTLFLNDTHANIEFY